MSALNRMAELRATSEALAEEPGGGWLARAIADGVQAEIDTSRPPTVAEEVASVITSGLVGRYLLAELWLHCGTASRADLFAGIALAATELEARITLMEIECRIAQAETAVAA